MKTAQFYKRLAKYYDFICSDRSEDVRILRELIRRHMELCQNNLTVS
jgi:hypothetical protein